jgi:hypothetical protein
MKQLCIKKYTKSCPLKVALTYKSKNMLSLYSIKHHALKTHGEVEIQFHHLYFDTRLR